MKEAQSTGLFFFGHSHCMTDATGYRVSRANAQPANDGPKTRSIFGHQSNLLIVGMHHLLLTPDCTSFVKLFFYQRTDVISAATADFLLSTGQCDLDDHLTFRYPPASQGGTWMSRKVRRVHVDRHMANKHCFPGVPNGLREHEAIICEFESTSCV